jgi:spore coat protein U-like protein
MTALPAVRALAAAALLGAWAAPAGAASCDVSPQGVGFGGYDPLAAGPLDGVGNIAIRCDAPVSFTVSLGAGAGSYSERRMNAAGAELGYNLYVDASRLVVWGDGGGGSTTYSTTADTADIPVYGRIPAHRNVPAGAYADTIVVTITY